MKSQIKKILPETFYLQGNYQAGNKCYQQITLSDQHLAT